MNKELIYPSIAFVVAALIGAAVVRRRIADKNLYEKFTQPKLQYEVYAGTKKPDARTILISGGNGFLGRYIVQALVGKGLNVIVFDIVLPTPQARDPNVTYVRGNLLNPEHIKSALLNTAFGQVHSVIHTASLIPFLGVPEKAIWAINVNGAELLLNLSGQYGVKSFIYTSSATVVLEKGYREGRKLTEETPAPKAHLDTYTTTKYMAEQTVLRANQINGMVTCALRPAAIFGAGDRNVSDVHVRGSDRYIIGSGHFHIDWVPVECVASAHVLVEEALSSDEQTGSRDVIGGQVYNVGNEEENTYGWFNGQGTVGRTANPALSHWEHPHPINLPLIFIQGLSYLNDLVYSTFHVQWLSPFLTPPILDYTQRHYTFSSAKARAHFKYQPLFTVEEAIRKLQLSYEESKKKE